MEEFQQNEAFCFIKMMHLSAHEFFVRRRSIYLLCVLSSYFGKIYII